MGINQMANKKTNKKKLTWSNQKIKISGLIEWEKNPVKISKKEAAELQKSIEKFNHVIPFVAAAPIVKGKAELLDGHQRKLIDLQYSKLPPDTIVDVRVPSRKLTEDERKELVIRLRKNTGQFDFEKLQNFFEPEKLINWGFEKAELKAGGFDIVENTQDAEPQVDKAKELQKKWKTKTGQLWILGEHRLLIGDCTVRENVERLMGGERADMCMTDAPYNVAYSSRGLNKDNWGEIENDDMNEEDFYKWLLSVCVEIDNIIKAGAAIYLCHRDTDRKSIPFIDVFRDLDWNRSSSIIWIKQAASMGWQDYRSQHEVISYGWKKGEKYFTENRSQTTTWDISRDSQSTYVHPTQKPLGLFEKAITNSSKDGWILYEPFAGSGSQIIAAHNLSRRCYAMEISPSYSAVILQRFQDATGITPKLEEKLIDRIGTNGKKK